MTSHHQDALELLTQSIDLAEQSHFNTEHTVRTYDAAAIGMYDRVVRCAKAVLVLIPINHVEQGFMLVRSMFEDTLRLLEVKEAGEERAALLLGWFNSSYERMRHVFGRDDLAIQEHVNRQTTEIRAAMARLGIRRLRQFLPPKEAARRFGLFDEYRDYVFAHEFVHGGELSHRLRRSRPAKDGIVLWADPQADQFGPVCAVLAAKMLLLSSQGIAALIPGADPVRLEESLARASRIAESLLG